MTTESETPRKRLRRVAERTASTTILGVLTLSATVAAQADGDGDGGGGGGFLDGGAADVWNNIEPIAGNILQLLVVGVICFAVGALIYGAVFGEASMNPDTKNKNKQRRNGALKAIAWVAIILVSLGSVLNMFGLGDITIPGLGMILLPLAG